MKMTMERIIELLKIERECVSSANTCDRDCANCKLVQDDKELIEMYNNTIQIMTNLVGLYNTVNERRII